jgi:hypothetical protein
MHHSEYKLDRYKPICSARDRARHSVPQSNATEHNKVAKIKECCIGNDVHLYLREFWFESRKAIGAVQ